jgi:nucleoside-diphosphate-sugar epimerase
MSQRILLTGATGLVGTQLRADLRAAAPDAHLVGTSRSGSRDGTVIAWDMAASSPPPAELAGPWHVIVNNAADVRWTMAPEDALRANVTTLDGLGSVANPNTHVIHVSTAFATGHTGSTASEHLVDYRNTYEWSKAAGERLAAERFARLTIVRPSLIMGRRADGHAARFAGLYVLLRGISSSTIPAVPAASGAVIDMVPVDDFTQFLRQLALGTAPAADGEAGLLDALPAAGAPRVFTFANGPEAPLVSDVVPAMVDALNAWRAERDLVPFGQPKLIEPDAWDRFFLAFAREHLTARQQRSLDLLRAYEPYLQLSEYRPATHVVRDVLPSITASARYWADTFPRLAGMPLRPWKAKAETTEEATV